MPSELPAKELARQRIVLTELRNRQHKILVDNGIARRILDAKVAVNYLQNANDFTEGSLLFPSRTKIAQTAMGILWGIPETISGSCWQAPQDIGDWKIFLHEYPNADAVMLGRLEAHRSGYEQTAVYAGIQLERGNPDTGVIPMDGVLPSDATELAKLLKEVEDKHGSGELSCLDPESLVNFTIGRQGPTPLP